VKAPIGLRPAGCENDDERSGDRFGEARLVRVVSRSVEGSDRALRNQRDRLRARGNYGEEGRHDVGRIRSSCFAYP
jgi:hypothetical protein